MKPLKSHTCPRERRGHKGTKMIRSTFCYQKTSEASYCSDVYQRNHEIWTLQPFRFPELYEWCPIKKVKGSKGRSVRVLQRETVLKDKLIKDAPQKRPNLPHLSGEHNERTGTVQQSRPVTGVRWSGEKRSGEHG